MEVFEYHGFTKGAEPMEIDIERFMTQDRPSGIYLPNDGLCAVNYGTFGPNKPIRGIQEEENVWEIDTLDKVLILRRNQYYLGDADKILDGVIFDGDVEGLLNEFEIKGYERKRPC